MISAAFKAPCTFPTHVFFNNFPFPIFVAFFLFLLNESTFKKIKNIISIDFVVISNLPQAQGSGNPNFESRTSLHHFRIHILENASAHVRTVTIYNTLCHAMSLTLCVCNFLHLQPTTYVLV